MKLPATKIWRLGFALCALVFPVTVCAQRSQAESGSRALSAINTSLDVLSSGVSTSSVRTGQELTLIAAVTATGNRVPRGQVTFCDTTIGSCPRSGVIGSAQVTAKGLAILRLTPRPGEHSYQAVFAGTNASAEQPLTVTHGTATPSISSSGTAGNYTLTGSVTGIGFMPNGPVTFTDSSDNFLLGTATLGSGTFMLNIGQVPASSSPALVSPNYVGGYYVATGDFNGDGKVDFVAVAGPTGPGGPFPPNTLCVFLTNGDGTFTQAPCPGLPSGAYAEEVVVGDFNNDGKLDLAVADSDDSLDIFFGNGNGTFSAGPQIQGLGTGGGTKEPGGNTGQCQSLLATSMEMEI